MAKFKMGDKVRVKVGDRFVNAGQVGIVLEDDTAPYIEFETPTRAHRRCGELFGAREGYVAAVVEDNLELVTGSTTGWTTDTPTKPGIYWVKRIISEPAILIMISAYDGSLRWEPLYANIAIHRQSLINVLGNAKFAGPIAPPEK